MSELSLDTSERRTARAAAVPQGQRSLARPLLLSVAGAAVLSAFAVAASSVMAGLVTPIPRLTQPPAIGQGLASSWPDLKDGLPARAGEPVKITESKAEAPKAAPGPRMAAFSTDPQAFDGGTPTLPTPQPKPVAQRPAPVKPTERIPVPTEVAVQANVPAARIVTPSRTVAALAPRPSETVRARDEAVQVAEEPPKAAPPKPVAVATPAPAKPKPAPVATAKPTHEPVKAAKAETPKPTVKAAAAKPAPAIAKPAVTQTASAEADSDETEILGVKLPSLAPTGRKIKDSVSALGDAVRSAF
ncbi:hypothetical protein [Methylobacterium sp. J-067]|uniref:hypothetical protein n=1 Tax=Methylobacterium sp. J-067 TaxID=2836648 RepID=UPI001FB8B428|nr:hypothetical protein [Methylobacterium sp. J-067]MCJ2025672.1 hypothetical protein [Methylobacterium sp. J-067]